VPRPSYFCFAHSSWQLASAAAATASLPVIASHDASSRQRPMQASFGEHSAESWQVQATFFTPASLLPASLTVLERELA
jgi:hypothetical protein